jgi:hypothetical protein
MAFSSAKSSGNRRASGVDGVGILADSAEPGSSADADDAVPFSPESFDGLLHQSDIIRRPASSMSIRAVILLEDLMK